MQEEEVLEPVVAVKRFLNLCSISVDMIYCVAKASFCIGARRQDKVSQSSRHDMFAFF